MYEHIDEDTKEFADFFWRFVETQDTPAGFVAIRGERRVIDTALGEALGYSRPRDIRKLIRCKSGVLRQLGDLPRRAAKPGAVPTQFLLNCAQATFLIRCPHLRKSKFSAADRWIYDIHEAVESGRLGPSTAAMTMVLQGIAAGSAPMPCWGPQ
jgi:hypothetical protein